MALNKSIRDEKGQALILVVILLLVGGLIITPLLSFMGTGLKAGQAYEQMMDEVYACDAGVEHSIANIINADAPEYNALQDLPEDDSHTYTLTDPVNEEIVNVSVTKLTFLEGILAEDEYKLNQPHETWINLLPITQIAEGPGYCQYNGTIELAYTGVGNRQIQIVGVFLMPLPGEPAHEGLIVGPDDYQGTEEGVITFDNLESTESKILTGGFALLFRWQHNQGPIFGTNDTGAFSFNFTVNDDQWDLSNAKYLVFATVKEEDISYIANGDFSKWLIEATAGRTSVQSVIITGTDVVKTVFGYGIASNSDLYVQVTVVNGDIYANGDITLQNCDINGDAYVTGTIVQGEAQISGDITEGGEPLDLPEIDSERYEDEADPPGTPVYNGDVEIVDGIRTKGPSDILDGGAIKPYHINGNVSIQSSDTLSMGPMYISGNLNVQTTVVMLEGTLYVGGEINVQDGQLIGSENVVAEGKVNLQMTGYDSEHIPVIMSVNSEISCQSGSQIGALLYAPNGKIDAQGVDIYGSVVGYEVVVQNSIITYTGPGAGGHGGWDSGDVDILTWEINRLNT